MRNVFLNALRIGGVAVGMTAYVASAQPAGKTLTGMDVGTPSLLGSTTVAGGKITVVGGGSDIWDSADNFHFAYFRTTGDFDYVMKVESLTGNAGDGGWSKVELMARKENAAIPGSPATDDEHISNMTTRPSSDIPTNAVTGAVGAAGVNYRGPQWRAHRSADCCDPDGNTWTGASSWTTPNPVITPNMPNNWVRLERVGSVFYMYWSNDGTTWQMYNPYNPQGWDTAGSWPTGTDNPAQAYFTNAWPAEIFVGIAVTAHYGGGADPATDLTTAVVSEFKDYTPVPIAITTQPPATLDIAANSTLTLSVAATGDPIHYQWRKNGTDIPRAVGATYSVPLAQISDSGTYTCKVFRSGQEIISSACVVTVTVDNTPPTVVGARPLSSATSLRVTFSEPVKAPSATTASNYQLSGGVTVSSAVLSADEYSVTLTTSAQAYNTVYTLTVVNVQDGGGNPVAAGTTINFTSVSLLPGYAAYERWNDSNGDLGDINAFAATIVAGTQRAPDVASVVNQFGGAWGVADEYNGRVQTYFSPPSNGDYVFFVASDDGSRVYLSTDESPANKKLICQESGWSNQYQWTAPGSGAAEDKRSDLFLGTEWETGNQITLQAGKRYYMEVLWNEGGGGDGADVTFIKSGEADPSNDAAGMHMLGSVISWFETADVLPPVITTHPTGELQLAQGASATLTVVATNPGADALTYQWTLNGRDIPGATSASYTIASAKLSDMGQYRVKVTNKVATVVSNDTDANLPPIVIVNGTGLFAIEGEDFDYNNGQTVAAASQMPYFGGAYSGLSAVRGVDYMNDDDPDNNVVDAHPVYRYGGDLDIGDTAATPGVANWGATIGAEQPGGLFAGTRGGEWTMTNNFKLGWVGTGNWGNYTRTFPSPAKQYYVFAAGSYDGFSDGQVNGTLGKVTAGVGTATQTVETFGTFNAQGTGNWSRNNLVAMTDGAAGPMKTVELGGTVTLRWTYNSGDAEYLLFYPATTQPEGPKFDPPVLQADGKVVISWTGTGTLQLAPSVTGPWVDQTGVTSPLTWTPPVGTQQAYVRIKQ